MSEAVLIAIVVVVLALVALFLVLPRLRERDRVPTESRERRPGAPGARRAGAGKEPEAGRAPHTASLTGEEPVAARRADPAEDDLAIPGFVSEPARASGSAGERPALAPSGEAPQSDARARARELQWGEDRDFEWVDTRGTRPRRRFERERAPEPRPERRV